MSAMKKLIVCGGNGFLGSRICKYAVARGWDVTSIRQALTHLTNPLDALLFIRLTSIPIPG